MGESSTSQVDRLGSPVNFCSDSRRFHKAHDFAPFHIQCPPGRGVPVFFDLCVAERTHSLPFMVAIAAFKGLMSGPMQFALVIAEKGTASRGIFIISKLHFTAFEGGREYTKTEPGSHFEHHALPVAGFEGVVCLDNCPPAGALAVADAHLAGAGRGRWIFLSKGLLMLAAGHGN